ncbi:hypothetical protein P9112_006891 [Eukaryota sp. TZLM1-RC]
MHSKITEHLTMPNVVYIDGKHMKQQAIIALATIAAETFSQAKNLSKSLSSLVVPARRTNPTVTSLAACALYVKALNVDTRVVCAEILSPQNSCVFGDPFEENFLLNRTDDVQPSRVFSRWNSDARDGLLSFAEVKKVYVKLGGADDGVLDFPEECSKAQFIELLGSHRSKLIRLSKVSKYGGDILDSLSIDSLHRKGLVRSIVQVETNTDCLMGWCTSLRHVKAHVSSKGAAAIASLFHLPQTQSGDDTVTAVLLTGGTVEPYGVGIRLQKALELMGHVRTFNATIPKDSVMVEAILRILSKNSVSVHDIKFIQGVSGPQINTQQVKVTGLCTLDGKFEEALTELRQHNVVVEEQSTDTYVPPNRRFSPPKTPTKTPVDDDIADVINRVRSETQEALAKGDIGSEEVGVEDRDINDVTFDSIKEAYDRLLKQDAVEPTFVSTSRSYSRRFDTDISLIFDNLQRTGSFKVRGSANFALRHLQKHKRPDIIIACSAGNHAQGVSAIAQKLSIPAEIVVPTYAPETKLQSCIALGATITKYGESIESAMEFTKEFVRRLNKSLPNGALLIHPFNQPSVIEGQGTLIHSFFEQHPEGVDTLLVSVGGGGLISATALYAKEWARRNGRNIRIVGVQAEKVSPLKDYLSSGSIRYVPRGTATIADGCNIKLPYSNHILKTCVDEVVTVDENQITATISHVLKHTRTMTEGAGSLAFAALLFNKFKRQPGERIGIILCGSNIDLHTLQRAHNLGLRTLGKVLHCSIKITDVAGQLARVARAAMASGVDLRNVRHDRHTESSLWSECILRCELQSHSFTEQANFLKLLAEQGLEAVIDGRELVPSHDKEYKKFDDALQELKTKRRESENFDKQKFLANMKVIHKE